MTQEKNINTLKTIGMNMWWVGHVDISALPSSYNSKQQAAIAWPEPFENYISEGSVSISTCDLKTQLPKLSTQK